MSDIKAMREQIRSLEELRKTQAKYCKRMQQALRGEIDSRLRDMDSFVEWQVFVDKLLKGSNQVKIADAAFSELQHFWFLQCGHFQTIQCEHILSGYPNGDDFVKNTKHLIEIIDALSPNASWTSLSNAWGQTL